jgi:flavin-dependent dehydrogenase
MRSPDPLSAAGIAEALHSGRLAAECVREALDSGDVSARRLGAAQERYYRSQRRLGAMAGIRRVFDRLDDDGKRALVEACRRGFHDRRIDHFDGRSLFVQLLRSSPGLVGFIRYLVPSRKSP